MTIKTVGKLLSVAFLSVAITLIPATVHADTQAGIEWTQQTAAANRDWQAVAFGNGLFVALANNGTTNKVMTSPDGVTWTAQAVNNDVYWRSLVYGNGRFVAVGAAGSNSRAMSSLDGITWTPAATPPPSRQWMSVTYGDNKFVAVAKEGYVMTSSDGASWTEIAFANAWTGITFANNQFVAVAESAGAGRGQVMTSANGTSWTLQTAASVSSWASVTYGNGIFVATAWNGTDRVMTSPDGITWTAQTATSTSSQWLSVTFGAGIFVAVSLDAPNRVMTSPDGITWTARDAASPQQWLGVAFGNNTFVAVAVFAGLNGVMSSAGSVSPTPSAPSDGPVFSLSFDSMPGFSISAGVGSWVTLPTPANPPASSPNSTFLGWATYEGFPVQIAQRQVSNGWGAYEVFRDDGSLRGVFIPAGGAACIAAPAPMFAVWSAPSA